jgi:hypothetical protein
LTIGGLIITPRRYAFCLPTSRFSLKIIIQLFVDNQWFGVEKLLTFFPRGVFRFSCLITLPKLSGQAIFQFLSIDFTGGYLH